MSATPPRQPHAVLDLRSRRAKALKIERLLELANRSRPLRFLEIGTGSGGIAHYFATHPTLRCVVTAVDVVDQRQVSDGYAFHLVQETALPFPDGAFDIVLSNHVIEHVGERSRQLAHLREMHRVMASDGVGYLAVPNRWMLVEPHYRLAFLSWLPRPLRSPYLQLLRRADRYDCEPLSPRELHALLHASGFAWQHLEGEALRVLLDIEEAPGVTARIAATAPNWALSLLRILVPTLICRVAHRIPAPPPAGVQETSESPARPHR